MKEANITFIIHWFAGVTKKYSMWPNAKKFEGIIITLFYYRK